VMNRDGTSADQSLEGYRLLVTSSTQPNVKLYERTSAGR
jgi:hypothetical protein